MTTVALDAGELYGLVGEVAALLIVVTDELAGLSEIDIPLPADVLADLRRYEALKATMAAVCARLPGERAQIEETYTEHLREAKPSTTQVPGAPVLAEVSSSVDEVLEVLRRARLVDDRLDAEIRRSAPR